VLRHGQSGREEKGKNLEKKKTLPTERGEPPHHQFSQKIANLSMDLQGGGETPVIGKRIETKKEKDPDEGDWTGAGGCAFINSGLHPKKTHNGRGAKTCIRKKGGMKV